MYSRADDIRQRSQSKNIDEDPTTKKSDEPCSQSKKIHSIISVIDI
jgi:hypothetical protein